MKDFLGTPTARRTAWVTLVALLASLAAPGLQGRAEAQLGARTAYLVPLAPGQGVTAEIAERTTHALAATLRSLEGDRRVKQPLELVNLSLTNPLIKRAIDDGALTEDQILSPPRTEDDAVLLARALGLTTILTGSVEMYKEDAATSSATIDVAINEYYVPAATDLPPTRVRSILKATTLKATDERGRALLQTNVTERIAQIVAASLLASPELVPPEPVEPVTPTETVKKKPMNPLWIIGGVAVGLAAIFLIASIGGGGGGGGGNLGVSGVQARAEADSVRVTWTPAADAIGYNVYRRAVGNQTLRSRQSGFQLLLNPETNTSPTVVGGGKTSFIDTTATSGVIYEYAVAGVGADGSVGGQTTPDAAATAGPNIGGAPVLQGSAGNGFVSLNWTASDAFVDGYFIFRRAGGRPDTGLNSPDLVATVNASTSYDDSGVVNNTEYSYIIQPFTTVNVNQRLSGTDSNMVTVRPSSSTAPQAPRGVGATVDEIGRVRVTWQTNPETNIDYYEVLQRRDRSRSRSYARGRAPWLRDNLAAGRATEPVVQRSDPRASRQVDLSGFTLVGTAAAAATSFTLGPLADGTYTFAVRAVNTFGQRGPATAADAINVNAALAPPSGVQASGGDRQVTITWQPVAGDVQQYNIYRTTTPFTGAQTSPSNSPGVARVGAVASDTLVFIDTALPNNQVFYYAVTSVDSQGAESEFGKNNTVTGVVAFPHAAPATMAMTVSRNAISGNGQATSRLTVSIQDATGAATAGVRVNLTTDNGTFVNPSATTSVTGGGRLASGLTDAAGELILDLQSSIVAQAGTQLTANVQARAPELPDAVELETQAIVFLASVPVVVSLLPGTAQLTADNASTTNLTARVLDALGQPVPNSNFSVDFLLNSSNGQIRRSGAIAENPFVSGPATVTVPVVNGQAVAVYKAGTSAVAPGNVVRIVATVAGQAILAETVLTLIAGAPARVDFGQTSLTMTTGSSQQLTVTVRDAQQPGNPVAANVVVNFEVQPAGGVISVPATATTDANGQLVLDITAGPLAGGAVIVATVPATGAQSQLSVIVQ